MDGAIQINNSVLDLLPTIKPAGFAVYAYLCKCADETGTASPKQKDIEKATGISDRYVRTLLDVLESVGLLIQRRTGRGATYEITNTGTPIPEPQFRSGTPVPVSDEYRNPNTGTPVPQWNPSSGIPAQDETPHLVSDIKSAPPIIPPKPDRTDDDPPIRHTDELTFDDLEPVGRAYSGGAPGPTWCKQFRKQPQVLIDLGFTVRRSDLMAAAVAGRARHEEEKGGAPRYLDYFDKALDAAVRAKGAAAQTATFTETPPETEAARQQREIANKERGKSILAEAQATFAAARAAKEAKLAGRRYEGVLQ